MAATAATDNSRTPPSSVSPQSEYLHRRAERESTLAGIVRRDLAISRGRTIAALLIILTGWLAFGPHLISGWCLIAPVALFIVLVVMHERVLQVKERAERSVAFYDAGLRRIENRWMGRGVTRTDFAPLDHPFAADLDIFGRGSLFDLLCIARTQAGQECLARWLLNGATTEGIVERQAAVNEMRSRLDFREQIALLGDETQTESGVLETWGEAPPYLEEGWLQPTATLLAIAGVLAVLAWWPFGAGPIALIAVLAIGQLFLLWLRRRLSQVLHGVDRSMAQLDALRELMSRLEREPYECALLRRLRAEMDAEGAAPSVQVGRLRRLLEWLQIQSSIYFAPFARLLLWSVHFALAIERWRRANGSKLRVWLRVIGEFEALSSLACYAFEHPDDPFPELTSEGPCFVGEQIGHPLLPVDVTVRNDVALGSDTRLHIVSGSNMSGKSTLMRTVGVNAALALAGGPVRAARLRLSPLQIGASLRTQDSLQGGVSRFYAEIMRLRQIVAMTEHAPPLLFLLDEILHGTNSHDRLIGAEAIVRSLVSQGAIGFITTHDLALARIESDPALRAENVHFEDQLVDGKMSFDYRLRPGVVTRSNALELMRAVGLDV